MFVETRYENLHDIPGYHDVHELIFSAETISIYNYFKYFQLLLHTKGINESSSNGRKLLRHHLCAFCIMGFFILNLFDGFCGNQEMLSFDWTNGKSFAFADFDSLVLTVCDRSLFSEGKSSGGCISRTLGK